MPVRKVPGGYQWGYKGKVYKTKHEAETQGRAAYASGYRDKDTEERKPKQTGR